MNRIIIVIIMLVPVLLASAQSINTGDNKPNNDELTKQHQTQIRYLFKQISALRIYLGHLKKGYRIVDKGLSIIGDIRDGKFRMDQDYMNALKNPSDVVKNSPYVEDIPGYFNAVDRGFKELRKFCNNSPDFTPQEIDYINTVHARMIRQCEASLDELRMVLIGGKAEMVESDRFEQLARIHRDMKSHYEFTKAFACSASQLARARAHERNEIHIIEELQ